MKSCQLPQRGSQDLPPPLGEGSSQSDDGGGCLQVFWKPQEPRFRGSKGVLGEQVEQRETWLVLPPSRLWRDTSLREGGWPPLRGGCQRFALTGGVLGLASLAGAYFYPLRHDKIVPASRLPPRSVLGGAHTPSPVRACLGFQRGGSRLPPRSAIGGRHWRPSPPLK